MASAVLLSSTLHVSMTTLHGIRQRILCDAATVKVCGLPPCVGAGFVTLLTSALTQPVVSQGGNHMTLVLLCCTTHRCCSKSTCTHPSAVCCVHCTTRRRQLEMNTSQVCESDGQQGLRDIHCAAQSNVPWVSSLSRRQGMMIAVL